MRRLRPSPAMLVALLALFISLGGVGYAAAKIGSAQIKNNSVRGKDIRNGTIGSKDIKRNLFQRTSGSMFATITRGVSGGPPKIVSGRGAVSTSQTGGTIPGRIDVTFNRSVRGCTSLATPGESADEPGEPESSWAVVRSPSSNVVRVTIYDSGGARDLQGLNVAVLCP